MALRRLGCEVTDIDVQTMFPQVRRKSSRVLMRLLRPRLVCEYNELILDTASRLKLDVMLAFKGLFVEAKTLWLLRQMGVRLYNYYPDRSPFAEQCIFIDSMWEYDCVFYTKCYWQREMFLGRFRNSVFVPHGYDPELHRPNGLEGEGPGGYCHDVTVVATHTVNKEDTLERLLDALPSLDLAIWGNGWERCRSKRVKPCIQGRAVNGSAYAAALSAARINLAIMSGVVRGVAQGDETTTRTYEIPACRGFMLHERSPELLTLFEEDKEVVCFDSAEEAAAKIKYYLAHPREREAIAEAGYGRCVPAYSYDNRMWEILQWHYGQCGAKMGLQRNGAANPLKESHVPGF
jgi:spore maturation protein CgeB